MNAVSRLRDYLQIDAEKTGNRIASFVFDQVNRARAKGVVVGISGGIDSAVVALLCVAALGKERVIGLFLPERDTAPETADCAFAVAKKAGIKLETLDLSPALDVLGCYRGAVAGALKGKFLGRAALSAMKVTVTKSPFTLILKRPHNAVIAETLAFFRLKHRLRMCALYHLAEKEDMLVSGCLNKTELLTGFFVCYGDNAADLAPILPLYKTQVRVLAAYLGVPEPVIARPPSPDLIPGITDEGALGIAYDTLDPILLGIERGLGDEDIAFDLKVPVSLVMRVKYLVSLVRETRCEVPCPDI